MALAKNSGTGARGESKNLNNKTLHLHSLHPSPCLPGQVGNDAEKLDLLAASLTVPTNALALDGGEEITTSNYTG